MKFPEHDSESLANVAAIGIIVVIIFVAAVFVNSAVTAFVLSTLWGWYIVPFFAVKELPLAIAYGISLIVSYLITNPYKVVKSTMETKDKIIMMVVFPLAALALGYIGTFFI